MGGFKNESNNIDYENNLFKLIVIHVSKCCEKMRKDCKKTGNNLYNQEDKISNRLVKEYLNADFSGLIFSLQNPENYDYETDIFRGRTDITVMSFDRFINPNAYYIIESKRLDGGPGLNKKYVTNGIRRFIDSPTPKYSSHYGKNIMLGYIVKPINVSENTKKIDRLQRKHLVNATIGEMRFLCDDGKSFSHYQCLYQSDCGLNVVLAHLFYDFSDVIKDKA
jgi:hypothetical protein